MKIKPLIITALVLTASLADAQTIKHPSLLFTPDRVEAAEKAMKKAPSLAEGWKSIKAEADIQLQKGDIRKLEYLALAYMMTDSTKYADKIKEVLLNTAKIESWGDREMLARKPAWRSELQMAHKSFQLAVAYDAVYDRLTPAERKQIAEGVYRLAVEPALGDWLLEPSRVHSLNSMGHNWWTSCVYMGALLGLSIGNEIPQAAEAAREAMEAMPEWFEFAGDVIQHKPRTFDRDGGMYESINYANFGISEALLFRIAWLNSHPGDKIEDIPHLDRLASFFSHVLYPRDGEPYSINFGDSHKNVNGQRPVVLSSALLDSDDPLALWYLGRTALGNFHEGADRSTPVGFLYTPDLSKAPALPDLPTSHLWKDFGWATMRDSWENNATMLAVKSGMTWNHSHADANSLILFHKGVDIIKDAGNCGYSKPEYRNYFFQSDAHNVVKFNGQGQSRHQQYHGTMLPGSVSNLLDAGNIKYVLADGTGPMSQWLLRNFRHYLWIDNVVYVVDDLLSHEPGKFEWLWHPGGEAVKRGFDLEITNGNSAALIRPLYPRQLAYSNFVHDYPEDLYWEIHQGPTEDLKGTEEYWSFHLPGVTDRVKGVTAIILKDSVGQKELPQIERREGKDWIGLQVRYKGKVTDIYINQLADGRLMHLNSWINADGWSTDAYMLAVSYPEGTDPADSKEMFIGHGSSLRRDGEVYFSSLAKLNVIAKSEGSRLDLHATGQPRMNFSYKVSPSSLTVNGKPAALKKKGNLINIRTVNE